MTQTDLPPDEAILQFRHMLPAKTATAQAIDQHEPWALIAIKAVDDGYVDSAHELSRLVGACVRPAPR